ncbi:MAG UNVERIFIED_CONTAM: hypothetical protein LVQ98_02985 [Rickettsiaceae bacterium]|jgi:hypothetical protein
MSSAAAHQPQEKVVINEKEYEDYKLPNNNRVFVYQYKNSVLGVNDAFAYVIVMGKNEANNTWEITKHGDITANGVFKVSTQGYPILSDVINYMNQGNPKPPIDCTEIKLTYGAFASGHKHVISTLNITMEMLGLEGNQEASADPVAPLGDDIDYTS